METGQGVGTDAGTGQVVGTGSGHRGIPCVLQTKFSSFLAHRSRRHRGSL